MPESTKPTHPRHPDEILADLAVALDNNEETITVVRDILREIIEDVIDSVRLAVDAGDGEIVQTVTDYVVNHYGDD